MEIAEYIQRLNKRYKSGISREHSYRGDLQSLIETISPDVLVTNEPAHIACGAPDYIITKRNIPIGYIEAKDIGKPLNSKEYKEQFDRYKKSLDNLIITDYLDFWLYRDSKLIISIKIACIENGRIVPITDNFDSFSDLIKDFCTHIGQTIKSASKLSKMMAGKARLLAKVIESALTSDEENEADSSLKAQMIAFKDVLIHDISPKTFADIYAQTIAYGMFAARLHDPTLKDFSRQEAAELIPKSNTFLRRLFGYIAGPNIDERIKWIVDALADIFRAADVKTILNTFGESTQTRDPLIHFYETFLAEYDPKLRKSRGVFYTPEPVVNFIVRAVDDILINEFNLPKGLADTSQVEVEVEIQGSDNRRKGGKKKALQKFHRVQILDPAAGTGTFLAEVVRQIYDKFKGQEGIWSKYVDDHLIPRLNGFELLMGSYSIAHLKLDMLLQETGYKSLKQQRLKVYLTNSLEEHHPDTGTLFASWLSKEANEANHIKRDTPVMCVIGNPPYSGLSSNMGEWIVSLIEDYKYVNGTHFGERKHWLHDDYVKFIRYGQHFIDRNGEGIIAYVNNHSFIDNPTFRGMRWSLLNSFDKIYVIDLHGSSKKNEAVPKGVKDKNVFDIQQGVSINIFIKTKSKSSNTLAKVFHYDIWGNRKDKYDFLWENNLSKLDFDKITYQDPNYFFVQKNYKIKTEYDVGFIISELFPINTVGFVTGKDKINIGLTRDEIQANISYLIKKEDTEIRNKFGLKAKDARDWKVSTAKTDAINNYTPSKIMSCGYRPFDNRFTFYSGNSRGVYASPQRRVMHHFMSEENIGLLTTKQFKAFENYHHVFISKIIFESSLVSNKTSEIGYGFPLYLYPEKNEQQSINVNQNREPNLKKEIIDIIASNLNLVFTNKKEKTENTFAPIDILDYIYAILHNQTYREKYKEFLKIDFPRVPYPKAQDTFWMFVKLGGELRQIHLLESPIVEKYITTYPQDGNNTITRRIRQKDFEITDSKKGFGRIWINDEQYFDKVPVIAWEFYIGGYQPAQKWLKDRYGRTLSYEDIMHYQKIIVALTETDRIMKEIDKIEFE
jgi:predicted helicase